jgi:hypothetical protein
VNDLRILLHESSDNPPYAEFDATTVLRAGRSRVRRRRAATVGVSSLGAAIVVGGSMFALDTLREPPDLAGSGVPTPAGPVLRLADAELAVEGRDYQVVSSYTNENLDRDNGQYLDGLTDDGLVLFRDGPRADQLYPRYALMDPATSDKDWLPDLDTGQMQLLPLELSAERLVLLGPSQDGPPTRPATYMFDRGSRQWSTITWPELPKTGGLWDATVGPDGRLYLPVPATKGEPPPGGWPVQPGGDVDDADADGDTFDLWSVSLTDAQDVRDEGLRVGDFTFTDDSMVWSDRTNGDSGTLHVRDLASGEVTDLDPRSGDKCNLLSFGASGERIVLGQYCGTYGDGVRDDRVQVLSTSGDLVATIQDSDIDGTFVTGGEPGLVSVRSHQRGAEGTYVYDLSDDTFVRVSDSVSSWSLGGLVPDAHLSWDTSANWRRGATQVIAAWQD